jgi:hypothetical protein
MKRGSRERMTGEGGREREGRGRERVGRGGRGRKGVD